MVVTVRAKQDITKASDGTIEVPARAVGVVDAMRDPPENTFQVSFTVETAGGPTTVQKWVEASLLDFDDGPLGPARVRYEGSAVTVSSIRYPQVAGDFDGDLGAGPVLSGHIVEIVFSDATVLRVRGNSSKGSLDIELA